MGMGDSGRNMAAVGSAVQCLVDRERMSMAQSKVCVSSVGPSPQAFFTLAAMPAALAWYARLSNIHIGVVGFIVLLWNDIWNMSDKVVIKD